MKAMMMRLFSRGPSCGEVLEMLQGYLDGEIDADSAKKVAAHLDKCENCDRESTVYANIKDSLARRAKPVDPDILASLNQFGIRLMTEGADGGESR